MGKNLWFYLFWVEISRVVARHVLGEAYGLISDGYRMLDDVLELVFCVAGAELARVGVHCEGHDCGAPLTDLDTSSFLICIPSYREFI